ncbi:MAG TPA: S41 family peptidase, partial [Blastocatellia bacterium]|nr:S41 family peptidase [Blastocatellia bacterium]
MAVLLLLSVFASVSAGGAAYTAAPSVGVKRTALQSERLSAEDRREVFVDVWQMIDEKYYDPSFNGVNWGAVRERYQPLIEAATSDDEFYTLLKRMVGELRDAHTRFHTPRERRERKLDQGTSAGIAIYEVEGRSVVVSVDPSSEAARAGVEEGMIVRTIDGKPIEARLVDAQKGVGGSSSERANRLRLYRKLLDGEPGTTISLGLVRTNGTVLNVVLTRRVVSDSAMVSSRVLPSGFGYIRLNLWKSPVYKEFKRALDRMKDAPGIIVDLRGNPGGEVNEVLRIAGYFFPDRVPFGRFINRSGKVLQLFTRYDDDRVYNGPLAVLINESSGSASEMFSGVLQENGRAVVVGRQSCGCLLGIAKYREVEGGGELAISELGYISPKGKRLEGNGVFPNEQVALKIADLERHRDAAVEEAEQQLKSAAARVKA